MENIDPMGVHTGDSIVVAPSQTLTDKEYQMLRSASLRIIRALGIEGGCNVQYALEPSSLVGDTLPNSGRAESPYYVIEVNPRVSRSSALASKATGYPIARVAAKIAAGQRLDEITNAVTQKTTAAFEPALDYCVVKIPRWPFDKFPTGDRSLGTQMKATGEVMAIDRTFEAAFQKAVRSLEIGSRDILWEAGSHASATRLGPSDDRLWALFAELRKGVSPEDLSRTTGIDCWFTRAFQAITHMEGRLLTSNLDRDLLWEAKRLGFPDAVIGRLTDSSEQRVRRLRHDWDIRPVYKMVDTCAAEFEAVTPYFYSAYEQENEAEPTPRAKSPRRRQRPHPHRPGHRVRLLFRSRRMGARRGGRREHHGQLQPRDRLHRLRHQQPALLRAAGRGERARHPRKRGHTHRRQRGRVPRVDSPVRRPDRHQPVPGAGQGQHAHPRLHRALHRRGLRPPALRGVPPTASASQTRPAPPSPTSSRR